MASNNFQVKQVSANYIFKKRKVFNDPIHGQIEIHPVCVRIIDTPQFQRLRRIKQLDACDLVYPGACHTRFEHSIGTCYLAEKLMITLQQRQPSENIDERDILCVMIAALCHDLGQGPFSHIFKERFMPDKNKQFTHEETARKMFKYVLEDNNMKVQQDIQNIIRECKIPGFDKFKDNDFLFIEEMIDKPKDLDAEDWPYNGRTENKSFMYEIVANKRNGIDVDKWDYLLRDSYMLGIKVNFQYERCIMSAKVLKGKRNGSGTTGEQSGNEDCPRRKHICYREKDALNLYDMFYARMTLHRKALQHKTHRIIGMMICEALKKANDTVELRGKNSSFSIAEAVEDMEAFTKLTDDIFQIILYSPAGGKVLLSSNLQEIDEDSRQKTSSDSRSGEGKSKDFVEAKKILSDILNRRLFKFVTETQIKDEQFDRQTFDENFLKRLIVEENTEIYYDVVKLNYGMENKNPLENVRTYNKDSEESTKLNQNQVSFLLPDTFAEVIVRIYVRNEQHDIQKPLVQRIKDKFVDWCLENGLPPPKGTRHENTLPKSLQTSDETTQESSSDDLENKRLAGPNTVSANEEHEDSESSSTVGDNDGTRHENTLPKSLQTSDETTQESSSDDLENKRLAEPNTVSANEEHEDSESSSSVGGYEVRPSATDESGEY